MRILRKLTKSGTLTLKLMMFYLAVVLAISAVACYFAYQQRRGELLADMDMALLRLANEYESIAGDFWDIYIPLYQTSSQERDILYHYFSESSNDGLPPMEQMMLKNVLTQMSVRDDRIRWIAAVNEQRQVNYIYRTATNLLETIPANFPYWDVLSEKKDILEIYGERYSQNREDPYRTIAIAGGDANGMLRGTFVVGFDTSLLHQISDSNQILPTVQFGISNEKETLFSSGDEPFRLEETPEPGWSGSVRQYGGRYYVGVSQQTIRNVRIFYAVDYWELFVRSHRSTPLILLLITIVVVASCLLYGSIINANNRSISALRRGLEKIGANELDYRIQTEPLQDDYQPIAEAVNTMAQSLEETRERVYYYQLRQREAEIQELQAKFNPHFLYNSLEMFRARCFENGDEETAELIAQTAAIFRGFINPKTFIPIQEELAFSKRYLTLFRARYGDSVEILYDIDTEVLQYGIIRNVFQPLIENYFVHGIDPKQGDNYIRFSASIRDKDTILITVEDNGLGASAERIQELNESLERPNTTEKESYGIKNLHQRLRLFYGGDCGLRLCGKESRGIIIEMVIGRWTCEEAERLRPV